ncbi:MAG: hypothetical protein R3F48_12390 [Candidatus Zixiibacteriota bacterium]
MKRTPRFLFLGICALLMLLASQSSAKVFKWQDSSNQDKDLLLLGFGEVTLHYLDVDGNVNAFEEANPDFKKDFTSNYRLSLFANGNTTGDFTINGAAIIDSRIDDEYRTNDPSLFRLRMSIESTEPIWGAWRFTGKGLYDPNRQWELENLDTRLLTVPQEPAELELLMRLQSDKYGIIEGGSLRSSFRDAKFTLNERSLFGIYADVHTENEAIGAEAVGGKLEGKSYREGSAYGVRADGTTGPVNLDNAPVTRGSETVKIEVRDRFDETTILSSTTLTRDIDYTPDYLQGRILLHQPVASETVNGDPVYIVVTYDYLRDDNDEILGGRAKASPVDGVKVSGSYLKRYIDDDATGAGIEEPENLYAGDASVEIDEHTKAYFEAAGSENPNDDDSYSAVRAGAVTEAIKDVKLNVDFQRIDDDFRSFTNSDLNANKNQQRIELGGTVNLTESQTIVGNYTNLRGLEKNGTYNTYDGLLNQDIYSLGYDNNLTEKFAFGAKFERRNKKDRDNEAHEKNYQNRAIGNVRGTFKDFAFLGRFGYNANYELIQFRNEALAGDHDANTNQFAVTLTSEPTERLGIKFGQRFTLENDLELDTYNDRQDISLASVTYRAHDNLNFLTTGEYKRYTQPGNSVSFWQDDPYKVDKSGTFAVEYLPLEKIKAFGKIGRHDLRNYSATDSTAHTITDFAEAQLTYFYTHHLSFNLENEYSHAAKYYSRNDHDKIWDLGFKVNWNRDRLNEFTAGIIRRWHLQHYPPTDDIKATSYIALLSGSVSFTRHIFARGSVKEILLNDPLDDEKRFTRVEVGFDSQDWFRVSLGYERIETDVDDDPDLEYTGQGIFVRFSGKI